MNSTWMKIGIAYVAGMITYGVYQNHEHSEEMNKLMSLSMDSAGADTTSFVPCACDNEPRYNVSPRDTSGNHPIDGDAACKLMVGGRDEIAGTGSKTLAPTKGAWFSKVTLDLLFCRIPDANGIFVYKGSMKGDGKDPVYLIEAGRTNYITVEDDGVATMYYSRAMCPTVCGSCY